LNPAAFSAILAAQGGNIFIGGIDSGELSASDARDFGAPSAFPAELLLVESEPVPEPKSAFMLATIFGILAIGYRCEKWKTSGRLRAFR
jgi:hypothetical protein